MHHIRASTARLLNKVDYRANRSVLSVFSPSQFISTTRMSEAEKPAHVSYARRLKGFDAPTVWQEFTPLAIRLKSDNLGQGFPDWETPQFVKDALVNATNNNFNQYCRSPGELSLVEAVAKHYSPLVGRTIDPLSEVTISVGATEALFAIMQSLVEDGDEVIMLEPAFDIYPAQVQMAGGVSVFVPLRLNRESKQWVIDLDELESKISPRTKIVLLNTPHNPTGKVFTRDELERVADIVRRNPHITIVTDEVYEKLVYGGKEHIRLASLPGMWERTITVSSSGKTFSCTGWKVGWVFGAAHLVKPVVLANQWVQFSVSTPTQRALAEVITKASQPYEGHASYYEYVNKMYEGKRDRLVAALTNANLTPYVPDGGFFIMADTATIDYPESYRADPGPDGSAPVSRDWGFARWLSHEVGVTPIPPSAFYTKENKYLAENLARFAFCKTEQCLESASRKLNSLAASQK